MAAKTSKEYPALGQEVHEATLDNGLKVILLRKPGFQKKYMTFSTHYGGMDSVFIRPGEDRPTEVPDGIAHFLEHKLFEEPDGTNVLDKYSRLGASPNAYTGSYYTVYLCSLVDGFDEGLDLLLDYVQRPYFTDENVQKEQGIIGQEIEMYLDNPFFESYVSLAEALFHEHPARIRVIGSIDSISRITKELLYQCHDTFYHPSNMIVTVVADVEFDHLLDLVEKDMAPRGYTARPPIVRPVPEEPATVKEELVTRTMRVSRPYIMMGFKGTIDPGPNGDMTGFHRRRISAELALQAILGRSNKTYWDLYERGVIASRYGYNLATFEGPAYFYLGAESEDPDAFRDQLTESLTRARDHGIDPALFEDARKREIGGLSSVLDDPEYLAGLYVTHYFKGLDFLQRRQLLEEASIEEGQEFLRSFVQDGHRSVVLVKPH